MKHPSLEPWRPGRDGDWNESAAAHLLRRFGFGASTARLRAAVDSGLEATLEGLFAAPQHDERLREGVRALLGTRSVEAVQGWWMALMLQGGAPLAERATLMWHDHFATSHDKVDDVRMMHRQNELFRELGLGDFRELVREVSRDPAMLVWLDGDENRRGHPNENFAREVLELFTLGIGNYTERDVLEAARAFTGWGTRGRSFELRSAWHDPGSKTIFGRQGAFDGDACLELIFEHPACPLHVARRLLDEFVSVPVEPELVRALAVQLTANDWHVGRTLRTLAASKLFFSAAARRSRIAGPVELIAITATTLEARVAPAVASRAATRMGQSLLRPPSVKGWDGGRAWINAGTWIARHNLLVQLAGAHVDSQEGVTVDLEQPFGKPSDVRDAALRVAHGLFAGDADEAFTARLVEAAEQAKDTDRALSGVTALALTAPEYQLI